MRMDGQNLPCPKHTHTLTNIYICIYIYIEKESLSTPTTFINMISFITTTALQSYIRSKANDDAHQAG